MKTKLFLLITISILVSVAATAQFNLGVKGGANISKIEGRSFKEEFRYGYHLGGFVEVGLGGRLGLQPEVLFNQYSLFSGITHEARAKIQTTSCVILRFEKNLKSSEF